MLASENEKYEEINSEVINLLSDTLRIHMSINNLKTTNLKIYN